MPFMVGGGDRRADRVCFLLLLSAVFLLSVGVAAIPEEQKSVQEQPPQEVNALTSHLPIKYFIVIGWKAFLTPLFANASGLASYAN